MQYIYLTFGAMGLLHSTTENIQVSIQFPNTFLENFDMEMLEEAYYSLVKLLYKCSGWATIIFMKRGRWSKVAILTTGCVALLQLQSPLSI